ncbi:MAG: hypothetical protein IPJ06_19595 [Saprospiraceae bacterium]|nr:hypothetical protein [Saprospiraceae bacterium]
MTENRWGDRRDQSGILDRTDHHDSTGWCQTAIRKGINLPDSNRLCPLTAEDRRTLPFIVEHADMVGYSLYSVRTMWKPSNRRLNRWSDRIWALSGKIETRLAFDNLPGLLLTAMRSPW